MNTAINNSIHITSDDIADYDSRYRAKLINSLSGFKSANLIGTIDEDLVTNLAIVSSVFHLGANPPLMGMIIRPDTVPRDTLANIRSNGSYTINHVNSAIYQQAHQTSARYDASVSEFDETQLTPQFTPNVKAPYVAQSHLKFALEVRDIQWLAVNGTVMVIGEIMEIITPSDSIKADGYIDIEALDSVAISGLDGYHQTTRLNRLSYAKVATTPSALSIEGANLVE
ncbi:flavin reductase [Psychrobium sp. MM17-31]|uniref:flavin reductase family protein n=1 Tax=Psychrobium sp. MM17-31 TaxID=2917758 RepID=UPI001EF4E7BB|nr:flavin reductase [Psychrobium sp. MM17-31]MCG7530165.1 flavin reductase [Psychrobium sp. MM17-31]